MEKLIEKISKLMEKAKSTTSDAEAQSFYAKAQELMAKHDLEMSDIIREPETAVEEHITEGPGAKSKRWKILASVIGKNFKVRPIMDHRGLIFVGLKSDVKIAKTVFQSAAAFMEKRRWQEYNKAYAKGINTKGYCESWDNGFLRGLTENFNRNVEENALIIVEPEAVGQYLEKLSLKSGAPLKSRTSNQEAYANGLADGRAFNRAIE